MLEKNKKAICLIDDDPDEIKRFRTNLAPRFIVGAGTSIASALEDLRANGRERPDLFLLDMYHSESQPNISDPQIRLNSARAKLLRAEAEFDKTLVDLRQTPEGGFRNLRDVRSLYRLPRVPVAFFTRKGTLDNAVRAYEDEIPCPVIKKPDPGCQEAAEAKDEELPALYDKAFSGNIERVVAEIERVIRRSNFCLMHRDLLIGTAIGAAIGYVTSILSSITLNRICGH
jgi:CheY-like chemotaxis protein